ncbi:hypothetical protein KSP40_PGU021030 [Platanthera guangdongensis]|uniref:CCHC-type domain-containing protein n=1 Tax=Platanthera guangdongensis TaxID=2320717 RepID=A0ABR2LFI0_9ASPA
MKKLTSKPRKAAAIQSLKCFKCRKPGHIRRNCHRNKKEKSPVATTNDEVSWPYPERESEDICLMGREASYSDESKASTLEQEESSSESDHSFLVTESNGRIPPDIQRPLPASMLLHQESFVRAVHPHPGVLPPEIKEQTCASQYMEIQNLASENQRLAATHSASRHEFAAAQHELQNLEVLMMAGKSEHEHQIRPILDKIAKMEADLKASESIKVELQQAQIEAQRLTVTKQVLISNVQQLTQDLQKSHADVQHVSSLVSELDALRQEYQSCRATYEYERKLRVDHYELLQVMEKNYGSMVGEVENLRRGLLNATKVDKTGGPYGSNVGYKENDTSQQHTLGQSAYEEIYHDHQGIGAAHPTPAPVTAAGWPGYGPTLQSAYEALRSTFYDASQGAPVSTIYDATAIPHYNMPSSLSYYDSLGGFPGYIGVGAPVAVSAVNPSSFYAGAQPPQSHASLQLPSAYGAFQVQTPYGVTLTSARPEAPATQARR